MTHYIFDSGRVLAIKDKRNADPQAIGEELEQIRRKHGGELKPEYAVEEAKNRNSAMHRHFEWDDSVAAKKHRLDQARTLIRSIVRVESVGGREIPAFVSIRAEENGRSYRGTEEVLSSSYLRKALLKQADEDLQAFKKRYNRFEMLVEAIEEAIKVAQELLHRES